MAAQHLVDLRRDERHEQVSRLGQAEVGPQGVMAGQGVDHQREVFGPGLVASFGGLTQRGVGTGGFVAGHYQRSRPFEEVGRTGYEPLQRSPRVGLVENGAKFRSFGRRDGMVIADNGDVDRPTG